MIWIKWIIIFILSLSKPTYIKQIQHNNTEITNNRISITKYIGIPYLYGGNDFNGIDCSSLVGLIYKEQYNINIPRTSYQIANIGFEVDSFKQGDIMIFEHHVAFYINDNTFINATSEGVLIDSINSITWNHYWKQRYIKTIRVKC